MISLTDAIKDGNVRAFLWALRFGEGTQGPDGFQTLFGGKLFAGKDGKVHTFDDFDDHPRLRVTVKLKKGGVLTSTAAGAGQFLERTWDGLVKQHGFADFSPTNQELGMVALIAGRKALTDVIVGRWRDAVKKCALEWASLPGSPYGQPVVTWEEFEREYREAGGLDFPQDQLAIEQRKQVAEPAPKLPEASVLRARIESVENPQPSALKETIMAIAPAVAAAALGPVSPFAAALLPALLNLVPQLTTIFGSGSEVSQRNAAAVNAVVNVAKEAIGAKNEQEVLEVISTDPSQAAAVKQAIETNYLQIAEAGGGGIEGARDYNLKVANMRGPDGQPIPLLKQPAFVISLILLVMPLMMLADMFFVHPDAYDADGLRTQIVTGVLMIISMVGGFWLGSIYEQKSNANRRSTDVAQ